MFHTDPGQLVTGGDTNVLIQTTQPAAHTPHREQGATGVNYRVIDNALASTVYHPTGAMVRQDSVRRKLSRQFLSADWLADRQPDRTQSTNTQQKHY